MCVQDLQDRIRECGLWLAAWLGLVFTAGLAGRVHAIDFYLKAADATKTMPAGGPTVTVWGYVLTDASFNPLPGQSVQVPPVVVTSRLSGERPPPVTTPG